MLSRTPHPTFSIFDGDGAHSHQRCPPTRVAVPLPSPLPKGEGTSHAASRNRLDAVAVKDGGEVALFVCGDFVEVGDYGVGEGFAAVAGGGVGDVGGEGGQGLLGGD